MILAVRRSLFNTERFDYVSDFGKSEVVVGGA